MNTENHYLKLKFRKAGELLSLIEEIPAKLENIDSLIMYVEILKSKTQQIKQCNYC
ncbi:MAG: hypothetical protein MZV64_35965 [Ignavibacteriales bacterium]|nr:hypothetical protein [Ignavibacteriales bacterium]